MSKVNSLENGVLLRSPGPEKHQPSSWPTFYCFYWFSWLMVVRARFKLFGNIIWQISPMFWKLAETETNIVRIIITILIIIISLSNIIRPNPFVQGWTLAPFGTSRAHHLGDNFTWEGRVYIVNYSYLETIVVKLVIKLISPMFWKLVSGDIPKALPKAVTFIVSSSGIIITLTIIIVITIIIETETNIVSEGSTKGHYLHNAP